LHIPRPSLGQAAEDWVGFRGNNRFGSPASRGEVSADRVECEPGHDQAHRDR